MHCAHSYKHIDALAWLCAFAVDDVVAVVIFVTTISILLFVIVAYAQQRDSQRTHAHMHITHVFL